MENLPTITKRTPTEIVADVKAAAMTLLEVIHKKAKPVIIKGEQYLEYEDWQLISEFDGRGYTVKTHDAIPVEVDGIKGAKALADLYDKEGRIVGGAEGYCMQDEENWKSKPWFQLASMAQTRAGAKAFRNKFSFVTLLAGIKSTPAEEMEGVFRDNQKPIPEKPQGHSITEPQRKRFYAIAKSTGANDAAIKEWLFGKYGLAHTQNIPLDLYDEICKGVKDDLGKDDV